MRIIVFPEGGAWVGVELDHDVVSQGKTREDAIKSVLGAVGIMAAHYGPEGAHDDPVTMHCPGRAPEEYQRAWDEAPKGTPSSMTVTLPAEVRTLEDSPAFPLKDA